MIFPPREIVVIKEEEWFGDMNLTDNATFLTTPIKRAKTRVNKKLKIHITKSDAYRTLQ